MQLSTLDLMVLLLYFLAMALMGVYFAKRNTSTEEYFVGSRRMAGWAIGLSLVGTSISSQSFLGIPADAYKTTWMRYTFGLGLPFAAFAGAYIFLAFYRRTKTTSAFEYLEQRFGAFTRVYGAVAFLLSQVVRLAIILYLVAIMMVTVTGIPPLWAVLLCGVVVAIYTVAGGIEAVVWTDVIQTILLSLGAILCFAAVIFDLPRGIQEIFRVASTDHKFAFVDLVPEGVIPPSPWALSLTQRTGLMVFFVGLTHYLTEYACNQNVVQRYCASSSVKEARKAIFICLVGSLFIWTFFRLLGTALYVYYKAFPDDKAAAMLTGSIKAEAILPHFISTRLSPGIVGLILAGIFAAAMSSLDSSINAIATVFVVDIYRRHLVKNRDDAHYLWVARWVAIFASILMILGGALFLFIGGETLSDVTLKIGSLMAGGMLGLYFLGFFTTRVGERAVLVAILCTFIWTCYSTWLELDKNLPMWLRLPPSWQLPINTYYVGVIGHLLLFVIGYAAAWIISCQKKSLNNLTIWTQDKTPLQ